MWYREGRVAVTSNSTEVHGTGTQWVEGVWVGDAFQGPDGRQYEITNIASNTALSIAPAYIGPSATNQVYWTIPIPGRNKSLADRVAKATATFEDAADASSAYADESKLYSSQSKQFSLDAKVSENQAKAAETSSKTHADRSQQAADDAVATVTGGTASIDPAPGKIPLAGADAAIKQAWVKDLEFELDALRVARNKIMYGDGPYPVIDLQFAGAKYLDPRITFTRATPDWDEYGNRYEVDQPVLTDEGLWVSGARTNLLNWSNQLTEWAPILVGFSEGFVVPSETSGSHAVIQTVALVSGSTYCFSAIFESDDALPVCRISLSKASGTEGAFLDTRDLSVRMVEPGETDSYAKIVRVGERYLVTLVFRSALTGLVSLALSATPTAATSSFDGDGISRFRYSKIQLEAGAVRTPPITTKGGQVTVSPSLTVTTKGIQNECWTITSEINATKLLGKQQSVFSIYRSPEMRLRLLIEESNRIALILATPNAPTLTLRFPVDTVDLIKFAVSYNSKDVKFFYNGEVVTGLLEGLDLQDLPMQIGVYQNDHYLDGYMKSVSIYRECLSDEQLQELTS